MLETTFYRNRKTKRRVFILKESAAAVKIEHTFSQYTYWYKKEDFSRLFEKI